MRLINAEPVIGTAGKRIAFIHPESTHGVLVELYEMTQQEPEIRVDRARLLPTVPWLRARSWPPVCSASFARPPK